MTTNQTTQLPTAEQMEAHRAYLKEKMIHLEDQHRAYKEQQASYKEEGEQLMVEALGSCAANIWTTRYEVEKILEEFNKMYPEPTA